MGVSHISNRTEERAPGWSRRGVLTALGVSSAAALTGCAGAAGAAEGTTGATGSASATASASASARATARREPTVTVTPADGTRKASFTSPVSVTVADGTLTSVTVTGNDGSTLAGSLDGTGTTWTSARHPYSGTRYTVTARVDGAATRTSTFTTAAPGATFAGYFTPEADSTSGVGMPVSLNFTHAVTDRAAVQKAITVTAEPAVEVVGHWFDDTRLDFRPETYWAAGTTITLTLRLKDVEGADGVYGVQSKTVTFHIGREQISTVDLSRKEMTVRRDGVRTASYPVTGGDADHTTWGGIMVISERFEQTRMQSSTVGLGDEYDIADVPHAQRLTTSGTFIHGNYWAADSVFGGRNSSHGCVGLHDAKGGADSSVPGYRFYESSMLGDVVIVKNSGDRTVDPANGLNGWNLSWKRWKAGSAL
ncbi:MULTISPECIES: L,D-transpeptidase [Streptomyces]|uniref:Ig-like domain-containing protein n=1 Tax=Streptomyces doudnae TaxID=3075536 RepID=A0ABD5EXU8_9ACTN|nr:MULTISPECIES: Ig-like domain-containing protein [unclassified Streptomyces]MDT0439591.1 Ig-like domain-containing protein [Streptomyces sp. DSM 41981]MYQ67570.1 L,D-transpeptidase family protein [Streptomyces sp. SID4950]SCE36901.1 Lipoprotein-anchoring transpeptidase ErfK/SrfK [Streptomyces sp. SolWspMP-5a-2]